MSADLKPRSGLSRLLFSPSEARLRAGWRLIGHTALLSFSVANGGCAAYGRVICRHEVAGARQQLDVVSLTKAGGQDLSTQEPVDGPRVKLAPYQVRWIAVDSGRSG